jgi:predicted acylesterase/phospholipase RssA
MSQQDGFASGFIFGAIVGGAIGGIVGALAATKRRELDPNTLQSNKDERLSSSQSSPISESDEASIEIARHSLEAKIAQLNSAIEDVRQQLSSPVSSENGDRE